MSEVQSRKRLSRKSLFPGNDCLGKYVRKMTFWERLILETIIQETTIREKSLSRKRLSWKRRLENDFLGTSYPGNDNSGNDYPRNVLHGRTRIREMTMHSMHEKVHPRKGP